MQKTLDGTKDMKFNEINRIFGESVQLAYESYFAILTGDKVEENKNEAFLNLMSLVSMEDGVEIVKFAKHHLNTMVKENETAEIVKTAAPVHNSTVEKVHQASKRVLNAAAKSIGENYQVLNRTTKNGGYGDLHTIGSFEAFTAAGLWKKVNEQVSMVGDRKILKAAKYVNGIDCFRIVEG